jgi:succinate-acetate transporter protein
VTGTTVGSHERDARPGLETPAERASWDGLRDQVRITVRPVASPSTIGLFGLAAGTFVLAGLQLEWVPQEQGDHVAFVLIGFAFASQLLASIVAVLARDVVVATAMCVLALTWLVTGLVLWTAPPGSTSDALGLLLIASCVTMALIGLTATLSKVVPGIVFLVAAVRFGLTGVYELSADDGWKTAAGVVGLVLAALAVYTGWALLVEGATKKPMLPVGRRGAGALAVHGSLFEQVKDAPIEPGVRSQL